MLLALLPTLFLIATAAVAIFALPAGADQISNLKAQAKTISQNLVEQQLQVGAFQQQYSVASQKVEQDSQAITQTQQRIIQDRQEIDHQTHEVQNQAITSYMAAGADLSNSDAYFNGNVEKDELANVYTALSAGVAETALDRLHIAESTLQQQEETLLDVESQDRAEQSLKAQDLSQSLSTQDQIASEQSEVTGQLAAAVSRQNQLLSEQAAAAVAAAKRAEHVTLTGDTSVSGTGPSQGSGLNPILQCILRAESSGNYGAVSPNGLYMGGFQFSQSTWNIASVAAGLPGLVGVPPNQASPTQQDEVAIALFALDGQRPWIGDRC